jgi:hypothetical protein
MILILGYMETKIMIGPIGLDLRLEAALLYDVGTLHELAIVRLSTN